MLMMMETRFYVYLPEQDVTEGPLAWDQLKQFDAKTLVMTEELQEYWPLRRWRENGTLIPTQHEHYKAWFWLLLVVPGFVYLFAPEMWRMEWAVCWFIAFVVSWLGMVLNKRAFPRFPSAKVER